MDKKEQIIYEAEYLIHGNKTVTESAKELSKIFGKNISKRTLQLHMNKKLKELDNEKYIEVRKTIEKISKRKMSQGGKESKRETNYSKTLILSIANEMIEGYEGKRKVTLKMMSEKYNIPQSTLFGLLNNKNILDKETMNILKIVGRQNKSKKVNK